MPFAKNQFVSHKKHLVALDPRERITNEGNMVSLMDIETSGHYPIRHRQMPEEQSWLAYVVTFFTACFLYGIGAYAFVRYVFSLLRLADGLMHVDSVMRERYGRESGLDWNFFAPVGLITVSMEMYALTLTLLMMIRQCDTISKFNGQNVWDKFMSTMYFVMACGSLGLILLFFYFSTIYHFMIIHKVMSLSPNGAVSIGVFRNVTADLIDKNGGAIFF